MHSFIEKNFPYYLESFHISPVNHLIKWDWEYSEYLSFLKAITNYLRENPKESLLIFCSHPHCFTMGSGLQRDQQENLIYFNPENATSLPYPYFKIKRGGGLTFHFPGQIIIYPLMNLNVVKQSMTKIMLRILQITQNALEEGFSINDLSYKNKMLGLWQSNQSKIASIGMGLDRFVTQHGLALNFLEDSEMFQSLQKINPCGLNSNIYKCVESMSDETVSKDDRNKFLSIFLKNYAEIFKKDHS